MKNAIAIKNIKFFLDGYKEIMKELEQNNTL